MCCFLCSGLQRRWKEVKVSVLVCVTMLGAQLALGVITSRATTHSPLGMPFTPPCSVIFATAKAMREKCKGISTRTCTSLPKKSSQVKP